MKFVILVLLIVSCSSSNNNWMQHHSSLSSNERKVLPYSSIIANQYPFSTQNYYSSQYPSSLSSTSSSSSSSQLPSIEFDKRKTNDFLTIGSRNGFIRKVYSIFTLQILCTIITTIIIMKKSDTIGYFLLKNIEATSIISGLGSFGIILSLMFNKSLRYKFPLNITLVSINAMLQGLMIGVLSSFFWEPSMLLLGSLHTLTAFLAISFFSLQTKFDLTLFSSSLVSGLSTVSLGLILSLVFKMPVLHNFLSGISAIFMAIYIAHDTQKIVGGKSTKYPYSPKEYILAAVNLYQDVLNLFIYIMRILHNNKNKD